jgi:hypothetical protein
MEVNRMILGYFRLKESAHEIRRKVLDLISLEIRDIFKAASPKIEAKARSLFIKAISNCPEMVALWNPNDLGGELGVTGVGQKQRDIYNRWLEEITVDFTKVGVEKGGRGITCKLYLNMVADGYHSVLSMMESHYVTEKGVNIPWLQWLLMQGDAKLVMGYDVKWNPQHSGYSRTGTALMIRSKEKRWGIPPEYAGNFDNNFVTRALDTIIPQIMDIIEGEITA